jgi:argininosuccinate synthase
LKLSRQEEVDYLAKWRTLLLGKAQYSINKGLWGTSVGGKETLTSNQALPSEALPFSINERREK